MAGGGRAAPVAPETEEVGAAETAASGIEAFGADFMSRGSLMNFAEQLARMAPDDPRRKVVLEAFASDMRRPIDLPDSPKPQSAGRVSAGSGRA